ncbi:hypothetical protein M3Y99_01237900 [Aphelenchoides fujianensis]|nr:hypothetical protein M3Y99_01237900 [Aphelenchoides fujianensis]
MIIRFLPLLVLLPALSNAQSTSSSSNLTRESHTVVRNRRSNFPCGHSFVPCANELGEAESEDEEPADSSKQNITGMLEPLKEFVDKEALQFLAVRVKNEMDKLFNETERAAFDDFRGTDFLFSTLAWNELRSIDRYAKDMSYSALVSIGTTEKLQQKGMSTDMISNILPLMAVNETVIKKICPLNVIADCIPGKYRTYSGHCNNVQHPLRGATYEPMQRLIPPAYSDGVSKPRVAKSEKPLTSARQISRTVFANTANFHRYCTLMLAHWAEFVYADLVHIGSTRLFKENQSLPLPCCAVDHPECLPILTDPDDQPYNARGQCISYSRSFVAPRDGCNLGTREQANIATSFLDASHLYGSTADQARRFRTFRNGQLLHAPQSQRRELLPPKEFTSANGCASTASNRPCFDTPGYDMNTNPSVLNEYAAAVGLFFFTLLPDTITQVSDHGLYTGTRQLSHFFNEPTMLYIHDKIESILRHMIREPIIQPGLQMSIEFREHFLRGPDQYGIDLAALIIQQGRDHVARSEPKRRLPITQETLEKALRTGAEQYRRLQEAERKRLVGQAVGDRGQQSAVFAHASLMAPKKESLDRFDTPRTTAKNGRPLPSARTVSVALHDDNEAEDVHFSHMLMQMGQILDHDFTHSPLARGPGNAVLNCKFCLVDERVIPLSKTKRITPCITCTCTADGTECHSMTIENCDDLLTSYTEEEIKRDTVCLIQCSRILNKNTKAKS